MYKKKLPIIISGFVLIIIAILIYLNISSNDAVISLRKSKVAIINVDKIIENPEKFIGEVGIEGQVTEVMDTKKLFALGCEDACIVLPVAYEGKMPKVGSNIVALGEVKKDIDGKFFFDARELKYK